SDGLDGILQGGTHAAVTCTRKIRADQPDLRTWGKSALFETAYHWFVLLNALCGGAPKTVTVLHATGDSRPEKLALEVRYEASVAELRVETDAKVDELSIVAGERSFTRSD